MAFHRQNSLKIKKKWMARRGAFSPLYPIHSFDRSRNSLVGTMKSFSTVLQHKSPLTSILTGPFVTISYRFVNLNVTRFHLGAALETEFCSDLSSVCLMGRAYSGYASLIINELHQV